MNLLDLAVKIGVDDQASSKIGSIASGVTGTLGGIAKIGATAFAAVGTAAVGATGVIAKQALDAYSSYEQNVGGIQKLFGNMGKSVEEYAALTGQSVDQIGDKWQTLETSQNKVLQNAQNAYKTAGISANEYMEQVTSFSAALITSLGNDTVKAADYADMAMVDMSDNANTFGTNIGDIQNAYQGFAKQNYTMLDNLKLGYGGTQSEMQRLIKDASKMTDVQEKLGVTVDSSSMSFDNIVAAIHVMQESMQVGGTTAREAATTIEGSVNAMKAAWDNWLVGLGDDSANIGELTGQLAETVTTAASNIVPRVSVIVGTLAGELPSMIGQLAPVVTSAVGSLGSSAMNALRSSLGSDNPLTAFASESIGILEGFAQVMQTAATPWDALRLAASYAVNEVVQQVGALGDVVPEIMETLVSGIETGAQTVMRLGGILIPALVEGITTTLPLIAEAASQILTSLGQYLSENGSQLIDSGLQMVLQLSESIRENVGTIVDAALQLALGLAQGLADGLPSIIENVPQIVSNIAGTINDNAPKILETGVQVVVTLINGLIQAIPTLVANIPQIIQAFVDVWQAFSWLDLGSKAITALGNGVKAMGSFIASSGKSIVDFIVNAIKSLPSTLRSLGGSAIEAMGNGIRGLASAVYNAATSVVANAVSSIASFPSKLFDIGKNAVQGLINGIKNMAGSVVGAISGVVEGAISGAKRLLGIHSPSRVFAEIGRYTMLGMEDGIDGEKRGLVSVVTDAIDAAQKAAELVLTPSVAPAYATGATAGVATPDASAPVTYNLYVDGLSVTTDGDVQAAVIEFARQIRRAASI